MLDDVYIPRKLLHRFNKIARRCKALCTEMFCKALSRTLNWKYHTEINISRLREVIALLFQPSEYIAVIVVGIDHLLPKSSPLWSFSRWLVGTTLLYELL